MKFKKIDIDYCLTICDRLTRLKPAYERYGKLFDTIIAKYCTEINHRKLSQAERIQIAAEIINNSFPPSEFDESLNLILKHLEKKYFIFSEDSYQYQSIRLNLYNIVKNLENFDKKNKNILWLKNLCSDTTFLKNITNNLDSLNPVKKIILCEGQTEYILLETLFTILDNKFNKNEICLIAAGGKNQVIKQYYKMLEYCKIPFFILMDKDADDLVPYFSGKLRDIDTLYIINSGEFEDLIPKEVIMKTLNYIHLYDYNCSINDFAPGCKMTVNIENIYRKYGFGEFKKAAFATQLNKYIMKNMTADDFCSSEIIDIFSSFNNF